MFTGEEGDNWSRRHNETSIEGERERIEKNVF